jgi:hypothetical protein
MAQSPKKPTKIFTHIVFVATSSIVKRKNGTPMDNDTIENHLFLKSIL